MSRLREATRSDRRSRVVDRDSSPRVARCCSTALSTRAAASSFTLVRKQQRDRHDRRGRIGDALSRDVGCAAVHGFEHRWIGPRRIDVAARRQSDAAAYRGGQVGDDVAEQVVGDDDVESPRVGDEVDGRGVDVLIGDLDIGVLGADLLHGAPPQCARIRQDVVLVHQGQLLAPPCGAAECVMHDPSHAERGVDADFGGDFVRCAHADRTARSRIRALGTFADHDEVDVRVSGQRTAHSRIEPGGAQVDVMVEFEPDPQQQTAFQQAAGHRRIADRSEQDRVVRAKLVEHGFRQYFAGGVVPPRPEVVIALVDTRHNSVEHLNRLVDDLRADAVAGDDRQFHVRSTTSSSLAPTAAVIAARTSSGTSRSMRSRIVAPGPSASSLSWAA